MSFFVEKGGKNEGREHQTQGIAIDDVEMCRFASCFYTVPSPKYGNLGSKDKLTRVAMTCPKAIHEALQTRRSGPN
jgi:hypothetical protein